jgi:PTH1 family peptidyl-tRNA hydrolase
MYLIVGLGNIGEKYQNTRHNVGFLVVDFMTKNLNTTSINNSNFQSTLLKAGYNLFSKPTTYMNNSGIAVKNIMDYYKVDLENIIIIHDDIDLPFGTVKFKIGGGHGGHRIYFRRKPQCTEPNIESRKSRAPLFVLPINKGKLY